MKFNDIYISAEDRYSIGIEVDSGKYYISIPVSNGIVDYEEYYEITSTQYRNFVDNEANAVLFVEQCRRHELDDLLIQKPGTNRGTPI